MRAAFSVWKGRIAPVFDVADTVHLVDAGDGAIFVETLAPEKRQLPVQRITRLETLNVDILVCGAISRPLHDMAMACGIRVAPFVAGEVTEVIGMWRQHGFRFEHYLMPGCRWQLHHRCRGLYYSGQKENAAMNERTGGGRGRGQGGGGQQGGRGRGAGQRPGSMGGGKMAGPQGYCVCPQCGHREAHQRGTPCFDTTCPSCGATMTRD